MLGSKWVGEPDYRRPMPPSKVVLTASLFRYYKSKGWRATKNPVLYRMIYVISTYVAHFSSYFIPHASERKWLGALWINSDINVGWLIYFDRKSRGLLPCCLCTGGGLNHSAISFKCFWNCAPAPQHLGNSGFIINGIYALLSVVLSFTEVLIAFLSFQRLCL